MSHHRLSEPLRFPELQLAYACMRMVSCLRMLLAGFHKEKPRGDYGMHRVEHGMFFCFLMLVSILLLA